MAQKTDGPEGGLAHMALLHPVRMRIVVALAGRVLTPGQLRLELPDVPQATLYQHIGRLTRAGVLKVVSERPAHGATERVYALSAGALPLRPSPQTQLALENISRYYATFIAALLADGGRYLHSPERDPAHDGFGFHQLVLYVAPEELPELTRALTAALKPYLTRGEEPDRRRLLFSSVFVPQALPAGPAPATPAAPHPADSERGDIS